MTFDALVPRNPESGSWHHPLYKTWRGMWARCTSRRHKSFCSYGDRGIGVCPEWADFSVFCADMGEKPKGFQLDRKNNDKGYSKENCHWVSPSENCRNRRNSKIYNFDGRSDTAKGWAIQLGITERAMIIRLSSWTIEQAMTRPPKAEKLFSWRGQELTIRALAEMHGIKRTTLAMRLQRNMPLSEALRMP